MNKRILSFLLCLVILITALLTASCEKKEPAAVPVLTKVKNVYRSDFITLPENYSMNSSMFISGGRVYMLCSELLNKETYETRSVLYSLDTNGENPESEVIATTSEKSYINKFTIAPDGSRVFVENSYDPDTETQTYILTKIGPDGSAVFSADAQTMFPEVQDNPVYGGGGYFNLSYMAVDGDGIIYLASDMTVIAVSPEGSKLFEINVAGYINEMTTASDGRVFAKFYDQSGGGQSLKYIDAQKKDFGEAVLLPSAVNTNNSQTYIGPGYDFYLKSETAVYGCNSDSTEPVELLNLINSDINSNSIQTLIIIDADHFVYTGYDMVTNKQQIAFLSRIPDNEVKEKYLINMSYINADYNLISYVVKFNQANDTYRIVMNDYGKYNTQDDYKLGAVTLTNEITAGKIPDIIILDNYGLDIKSFTDKGLFCDLYTFLDSDPDISRSDLLSCITVPFETDGKLYRLVTNFYVQTLAGKIANIGDAASWTTDEMFAALDRAGADVKLFDNSTKTQMLSYLCMMGFTEFIDYTAGSCSFDSDSFIKLLEYCNTLPAEFTGSSDSYEQTEDRFIQYRENKVLLNNVFLSSFSDYLQTQFAFGFEPVNLIGYPTSTGNGAMLQASTSYAITENSAVKEGAWQFLKYLLSDECQINANRGMPGWPATNTALQALAKQEMAQYNYFSYSGGRSSSSEPFDQSMQNEPGLPGRLTQEDVDTVIAYLGTITASMGFDRQVMDIINEETGPFFAGTKTAADAAKIIQSKISIYISETK